MRKRGLAILMSALMVFSMSGCGAEDSQKETKTGIGEEQEVELTLWGTPDDKQLLESMAGEFVTKYKSEAKIKIKVEAVREEDCKKRLLKNVSKAADVFVFPDSDVEVLAASGLLMQIEDTQPIIEANAESSIKAATVGDMLYAYPMTADSGYFLYYNKKYFKEDQVTRMSDILDICKENKKVFCMDITNGKYLYCFYGQTGLTISLASDGITNKCEWNSIGNSITGVMATKGVLDIVNSKEYMNADGEELIKAAKSGKMIACVNTTDIAEDLTEIWGDNLGATCLPVYYPYRGLKQMASFIGFKMVGVNAYSDDIKWSRLLAEWITSEQNQIKRFNEKGQCPSNVNAASSSDVASKVYIQALNKQASYASLERIGKNYWEPASEFGKVLISGKYHAVTEDETAIQEELDAFVAKVNAKPE